MTIIDPPSGWQYGFPKPIPEDRKKDSLVWLVEQGYPQKLIDELGEHFYCSYWETEETSPLKAEVITIPAGDSVTAINSDEKYYDPAEVLKLHAEYRGLSSVLEYFPKTSKHKAATFIHKRMNELLQQIKNQ
jgi:hypothetical protein